MIDGVIVRRGPLQRSPAGLPFMRLLLDHRSRQHEAGHERDARLKITVFVAGDTLTRQLRSAAAGDRVRVSGFLTRANTRSGENRLVLHAQSLRFDDAPP